MIFETVRKNKYDWHPWYAWFPVVVSKFNHGYYRHKRYAWLVQVQRKWLPPASAYFAGSGEWMHKEQI